MLKMEHTLHNSIENYYYCKTRDIWFHRELLICAFGKWNKIIIWFEFGFANVLFDSNVEIGEATATFFRCLFLKPNICSKIAEKVAEHSTFDHKVIKH